MKRDQEYYNKITDILYNKHYEKYIETGKFKEKDARAKAEKEAIEDARYVFPNACETKIVFTMNARSLMNFFSPKDLRKGPMGNKRIGNRNA